MKQDSIESGAIAIAKPDDELVVGNNKANSVDDGFVEVIGGEIGDGTTEEDRDMDLPLQYQRWIARMTKQRKAKQADVYLKKI